MFWLFVYSYYCACCLGTWSEEQVKWGIWLQLKPVYIMRFFCNPQWNFSHLTFFNWPIKTEAERQQHKMYICCPVVAHPAKALLLHSKVMNRIESNPQLCQLASTALGSSWPLSSLCTNQMKSLLWAAIQKTTQLWQGSTWEVCSRVPDQTGSVSALK